MLACQGFVFRKSEREKHEKLMAMSPTYAGSGLKDHIQHRRHTTQRHSQSIAFGQGQAGLGK